MFRSEINIHQRTLAFWKSTWLTRSVVIKTGVLWCTTCSAGFSPTFVGESRGIPLLFWRAEGPNPTFFPYFFGGPQARTLLFSPTFLEGWRPDPYFLRRYSWKFVRNSLILGAKNTSESSGSHRNSKIFACGAKLQKRSCFRTYYFKRGPNPTFSTLLFWRTEGPNPTFFPYFFWGPKARTLLFSPLFWRLHAALFLAPFSPVSFSFHRFDQSYQWHNST